MIFYKSFHFTWICVCTYFFSLFFLPFHSFSFAFTFTFSHALISTLLFLIGIALLQSLAREKFHLKNRFPDHESMLNVSTFVRRNFTCKSFAIIVHLYLEMVTWICLARAFSQVGHTEYWHWQYNSFFLSLSPSLSALTHSALLHSLNTAKLFLTHLPFMGVYTCSPDIFPFVYFSLHTAFAGEMERHHEKSRASSTL